MPVNDAVKSWFPPERLPAEVIGANGARWRLRKLIAFDDDTFDKLRQLARDRMASFQELADEAFADVLKKHGVPIDLRDALRKSAGISKGTSKEVSKEISKTAEPKKTTSAASRKTRR